MAGKAEHEDEKRLQPQIESSYRVGAITDAQPLKGPLVPARRDAALMPQVAEQQANKYAARARIENRNARKNIPENQTRDAIGQGAHR